MQSIESTAEVLVLKILNIYGDKTWVTWAVDMLVAGFDSEHLRILAGEREPFCYSCDMQILIDKVLNELQISYSDETQIIKNYATSLIKKALDGKADLLETLKCLSNIYCETNYAYRCLSVLYAFEDDIYEEWFWGGKKPTQKMIDDEIRKRFREFLLPDNEKEKIDQKPMHLNKMSNKTVEKKEKSGSSDRFWHPRFWDGMTMSAWYKQVVKGKFRVAPSGVAMFGIISALSVLNSGYAALQSLFYGRKIHEIKIEHPPVFIIGHWRSGTTLLHEYMILDKQFTFADTYSCFAPQHFLLTRRWLTPLISFLMPKKRPMDNMAVGLDRPQEDEFALCAMGMHSPYVNIIFPNNPPIDAKFLTLKNVSEQERREWLDGLESFLRCLTFAENKCVIFKSPPHTARIAAILERFPNAKFIHIHRNPYSLYASTFNLWMQLSVVHGLQRSNGKRFEARVFRMFEEMYAAFRDDISLLKPEQFTEIAYDALTSQPAAALEKVYHDLNLSGFEQSQEKFLQFAASQKSYQKNKFHIDPDIEAKITERWAWYIERYGYQLPDK